MWWIISITKFYVCMLWTIQNDDGKKRKEGNREVLRFLKVKLLNAQCFSLDLRFIQGIMQMTKREMENGSSPGKKGGHVREGIVRFNDHA